MRVGAAVLITAAVGFLAALEATQGNADPTPPPTVATRTVVVERTVQRRGVVWWSRRAVQARRDSNARGRTIERLNHSIMRRWAPSVDYALRLASTVYGVPYAKLRAVAWCESRLNVYARNGQYRSLFQEGPMFERGPFAAFGVYDPVANALTAAYTVVHDGGWSQWTCGGA